MTKNVICLALAMAATSGLGAEATPPVLDRLVDCADVQGQTERLACFDQAIAPLAKARSTGSEPLASAGAAAVRPVASPSAPARDAGPTPVPSTSPPRSFGEEQLKPKPGAAPSENELELHASIERLRTVASGQFIVYLDNGQAWRHEDQVQGEYLREGEAITISKGALGSYRLSRDAGQRKNWIRVTRIR